MTDGARFVLQAMLVRNDLEPDAAQETVKHTLAWLEGGERTRNGSSIVMELLKQRTADPIVADAVINRVAAWLRAWSELHEAGIVFAAWFNSGVIDSDQKRSVETAARRWAAKWANGGETSASLIVDLNIAEVSSPRKLKLISQAHSWLVTHMSRPWAQEVLLALLLQPEIEADQVEALMKPALDLAWRNDTELLQQALRVGLQKLPAEAQLRDEVEACLEQSA